MCLNIKTGPVRSGPVTYLLVPSRPTRPFPPNLTRKSSDKRIRHINMLMFLILTFILPISFINLLKKLQKIPLIAIHLFFVVLKSQ